MNWDSYKFTAVTRDGRRRDFLYQTRGKTWWERLVGCDGGTAPLLEALIEMGNDVAFWEMPVGTACEVFRDQLMPAAYSVASDGGSAMINASPVSMGRPIRLIGMAGTL